MASPLDLTTKDPDVQYLLRGNIVAPSPREAAAIQERAEKVLEELGFQVTDSDYVEADLSSVPSPSNQAPATVEEVEQYRAEVVQDPEEPAAVGPAPERAQAVIDGTFPVADETDEVEPTTVGGVSASEHQDAQPSSDQGSTEAEAEVDAGQAESDAVSDQAPEAAVPQGQRTEEEQEAVEDYEPEASGEDEPEDSEDEVDTTPAPEVPEDQRPGVRVADEPTEVEVELTVDSEDREDEQPSPE